MTDSAVKTWQIDATKCSFCDDYFDKGWGCTPAPDGEKAVILADRKIVLRNDRIVDKGYGSNGMHFPSLAREIDYTTWVQAETACIATEVALDRINRYHAANLPQ